MGPTEWGIRRLSVQLLKNIEKELVLMRKARLLCNKSKGLTQKGNLPHSPYTSEKAFLLLWGPLYSRFHYTRRMFLGSILCSFISPLLAVSLASLPALLATLRWIGEAFLMEEL